MTPAFDLPQRHTGGRSSGPRPPRAPQSGLADWWKIIAMGVVLAGLIYLTFFYQSTDSTQLGTGPPVAPVVVDVPQVDDELLATVSDATRQERLVVEPEPLRHLLDVSLDVVPAVAEALGMPDEPIPLSVLRANPDAYRGAYLAYEGQLGHVSPGKAGHPIEGYRVHEGWIDLPGGDKVLFRTSIVPEDLEVGAWCRIEGFFMKLLDSHHFPTATRAPLLVGPELFPQYEPWPPVTELNPAMFDDIRDGEWDDGRLVDMQNADRTLLESQGEPALWHLASYARHRAGGPEDTLGHWRSVEPFSSKEQLDAAKYGRIEHGTPFRLLGRFVKAEWSAARPNPIGATHWTQAWVQIRELGSKAVPVWIPGKVDDFRYNEGLEVRAYYYRNHVFEFDYYDRERQRRDSGRRYTPVFVAAGLNRFEPWPEHPTTTWLKYGFVALVAFVVGTLIVSARRDRAARARHEQERIERQRRRRAGAGADGDAATIS